MNATERASILDRLAAGQLSVDEAMRLLDRGFSPEPIAVEELKAQAMDDIPVEDLKAEALKIDFPEEPVVVKKETSRSNGEGKPRWLKIRVRDTASGRNKVSVSLPLGLVNFGLGIARRFGTDMEELDIDEIMTMIKSEERGMLVEVHDEEDNEQVQIYLD